jgi:hypothetical protein
VIDTTEQANQVEPQDGCPRCGERDADRLVWQNDDEIRCQTCGALYRPLDPQN